jgi:hypothetical protein
MKVTSCEEETRILFNLFQNPPKIFSNIPKCESKLSRAMSGWLGGKSKRVE